MVPRRTNPEVKGNHEVLIILLFSLQSISAIVALNINQFFLPCGIYISTDTENEYLSFSQVLFLDV